MAQTTQATPAAIAPPGSKGTEHEAICHRPLSSITIRPQVRKRFDERALAGLARSIQEQGVLYPVLCYRDGEDIVLIDGERRWRAAQIAGFTEIPARVLSDKLAIAEALARQLTCNLQNEPLDPIEKAEGIQMFMQTSGLCGKDAARQLGMEPSALCRALGPLKLPQSLRDRVAAGEISADAAYLLSRVSDAVTQSSLAERVATGELTRDELAKAVRAVVAGRKPPPLHEQLKRDVVNDETGRPIPPPANWRITRTIAPGVALAVTGATDSIGDLLSVLEQFLIRGREACAQGIRLPRFLAEFRQSLRAVPAAPAAGKGVAS